MKLNLLVGHAYDLLSSIRLALRKKGALLEEKEKHARGQREHTRGQHRIKGVQDQARFLADIYNQNLARMKKLLAPAAVQDGTANIPPGLRTIDKAKDLTIPPTRQLHNTGDTRRHLPWIFQPSGPQSLSTEAGEVWERECTIHVLQVHRIPKAHAIFTGRRTDWFRAWAAKKRTDEEVNLLYADGRAARRGFEFAARLWGGELEGDMSLAVGARAYATQKSAMFRDMARDMEHSVTAAYVQHVENMRSLHEDDEEGLKMVYHATQDGLTPTDDRLDYTLVSISLKQSQLEWWLTFHGVNTTTNRSEREPQDMEYYTLYDEDVMYPTL